MKQNALLQFRRLRERLTTERDSLSQRLAEINEALGSHGPLTSPARTGSRHDDITPKGKPPSLLGRRGPRRMSAAARAKIGAAQRRRWAKWADQQGIRPGATATKSPAADVVKAKRTMSAAARKKIAEAQRRRWAEMKAGK